MDRKVNKILAIFFVLLMIVYFICSQLDINSFRKDFLFTTATVTRISSTGWKNSGDYSIIYKYQVNGNEYIGNVNYVLCEGQTKEKISLVLVNKSFPVAYSNRKNEISTIILTISQAKQFGNNISESLLTFDSLLTCK